MNNRKRKGGGNDVGGQYPLEIRCHQNKGGKKHFTELYADLLEQRDAWGQSTTTTKGEIEYWYCFDEFCDGTAEQYYKICDVCKEHGIKKVVDIGCCYPFQHRIFAEAGIDYLGLEKHEHIVYHNYWTMYYAAHVMYPAKNFVMQKRKNIAGISDLCVGYEANSDEVYEQIAKDFDYFCGGFDGEVAERLKKYFDVTKLGEFLYWCERKKE